MDKNIVNNLALVYAETKLQEFEISKREAPMNGVVDFSDEEIQYLKSAYTFAISKLS